LGDSGILVHLTLLSYFLIVLAILIFLIAWRIRRRVVRFLVGVILLVMAGTCVLFSILAVLFVAALGITALVLAFKIPPNSS
jgi:hypothetical protein